MASNKFKMDKIDFTWESKGCDRAVLDKNGPIVGIYSISKGKTPANPNPRVVPCLGCNRTIYPQEDCYGTLYKGQWRYICKVCYVEHGFVW